MKRLFRVVARERDAPRGLFDLWRLEVAVPSDSAGPDVSSEGTGRIPLAPTLPALSTPACSPRSTSMLSDLRLGFLPSARDASCDHGCDVVFARTEAFGCAHSTGRRLRGGARFTVGEV
jgi:hypothetical protein